MLISAHHTVKLKSQPYPFSDANKNIKGEKKFSNRIMVIRSSFFGVIEKPGEIKNSRMFTSSGASKYRLMLNTRTQARKAFH